MDYWGLSYYIQALLYARSLPSLRSTEPWRAPCAGSSLSFYKLSGMYSGNLQNSLRRIDTKLEKLILDLEYLKSRLVKYRFLDKQFLQMLESNRRLNGFPVFEDQRKTDMMTTLRRRYRQLSVVVAFFEYVPFHESNKALRKQGQHVVHDCLEILCEIEIALSADFRKQLSYVSTLVVPQEYRYLTKSQRVSWTYILIRDTLNFIRQMHHQDHMFYYQ